MKPPAIPDRLLRLIDQGRWRHPGDEVMRRVVPCIAEPLEFMQSVDWIRRESTGRIADSEYATTFKEFRGSHSAADRGLPWRDVERSLIVVVAQHAGDDVAVALDFRTSDVDPRVIASAWQGLPCAIDWVEVAPTFSAFIRALGIDDSAS